MAQFPSRKPLFPIRNRRLHVRMPKTMNEDAEDYDDDAAQDSEDRRARQLRRHGAAEDPCNWRPTSLILYIYTAWRLNNYLLFTCSSISDKTPGKQIYDKVFIWQGDTMFIVQDVPEVSYMFICPCL